MIRKFNYTGRIRIPERFATIKVLYNGNNSYFNANINIENFNFPSHAKIYVEPYFSANFLRFYFGTISEKQIPANTSLGDLPNIEQLRFRVKIVDDSTGYNKIIGIADNIYPEGLLNDGNKKSILPVYFKDIGYQIWKVEFEINGPVLILNNEENYPNIRYQLKNNQYFLSLIYPIAIRFVLQKIIHENLFDPDSEEWANNWLIFTRDVLGVEFTPNDNEDPNVIDWVDEVVNNYCMKFKLLEKIQKN